MPADLQRLFFYEVIPSIKVGDIKGRLIDVLLAARIRSLVTDPDADLDKPIRMPPGVDPGVLDTFTSMENLTKGARELVLQSKTVNELIASILGDKQFRIFLRDSIPAEKDLSVLNRLISRAAALKDEQIRPAPITLQPLAPRDLRKQKKKGGRAKTEVITNLQNNEISQLVLQEQFVYTQSKAEFKSCVAELVGLLALAEKRPRIEAQLAGLLRSHIPQAVLNVMHAIEAGNIEVAAEILPVIKLAAMRVYLQFNAIASATKLGESILFNSDQADALPPGELLRLRNQLARCAMRSGRAHDAVELYADIFAEVPNSPSALMNVVGSAFSLKPDLARSLGKSALMNGIAVSENDLIFIGDILLAGGDLDFAQMAFHLLLQRNEQAADAHIGLANLGLARSDSRAWRRHMRRYFEILNAERITILDDESLLPFAFQTTAYATSDSHPKITVIMTTFNSAATVERAISSVLAQSCANIELIVIDDVSTDETRGKIAALAAADPRVICLLNEANVGTYVSKNRGIAQAQGEYITFHDSDDWMHPERLATHLSVMKNGNYACTTSDWLRMDITGRLIVRRGGPYTHLNPASTFMPALLFQQIGPFDAVRTGADAEIVSRIRLSYGEKRLGSVKKALALGLHHEQSLTQSGVAAFDEFRYSPVRLAYTEAWLRWQLSEFARVGHVRLERNNNDDPFTVPSALAPSAQ